jgi:hypothetical protein
MTGSPRDHFLAVNCLKLKQSGRFGVRILPRGSLTTTVERITSEETFETNTTPGSGM